MHSPHHDQGSTHPPVTAESVAPQPPGGPQDRQDVVRRFEALVQLALDATVVVDGSGRIRLVNRQTEVVFGYSADELLGQPVELLIPERLRAVHRQHRADYASAPHLRPMGASLPLAGRRRDGSEFPLEASLGPFDEGGEALVIVSIRDMTERQRLEQERETARAEAEQQAAQLAAIFEAMADGVVVFDREGHLLRQNSTYPRLLGADAAPAHFADLPVPERVALFATWDELGRPLEPDQGPMPRALRGEVVNGAETMNIRSRTLDGRELELSVTAVPFWDREGQLTGAVGVVRDQTERKRVQREREAARASELAAQKVIQQLNAFLATAAHDIRTPLTMAAARVQVAERQAERLAAALTAPQQSTSVTAEPPEQLADHVLQSLRNAQDGMRTLRRLVRHLFDVAQLQTETLVLELAACDLKALVERNVAAVKLAAHGRRIRVQVPADAVLVEADVDRLDQVLSNYLTNALKYSPANRQVTVKLEVVDNQAVVSVADHGPGVPPEEQSRIWEMFYRSPQVRVQPGSRTDTGSLGLGLHICKQLVELHRGGHVGVDSEIGAGSTFWFRLPLAS